MKPDSPSIRPADSAESTPAEPGCPARAPQSLYVHWPFCQTKCGYCDFYSVPVAGRRTEPVLDAILAELCRRISSSPSQFNTMFVGGGTPTTLDADNLGRLLAALRDVAGERGAREFSVEANPATIDADKALRLAGCGVNRVSIGAQSFQAEELAFLERIHCVSDIGEAVETVRTAGISNISLDLMFGIANQTMSSWTASLQRAIDLSPQHIACYGLTYEPGTRLTAMRDQGTVRPCEESIEVRMYEAAIDVLESAGFEHYEISNFARPGFRCEHNLTYWRNEPFIGIGPSAAGFVGNRRYKNVADVAEYVRRIEAGELPEAESETLTPVQFAMETLMMSLRLIDGIDFAAFERSTGIDMQRVCARSLAALAAAGLIAASAERLRLTRSGLLVADSVLAELATGLDVADGEGLPLVQTRRSS